LYIEKRRINEFAMRYQVEEIETAIQNQTELSQKLEQVLQRVLAEG
jgi:hypothetical protein